MSTCKKEETKLFTKLDPENTHVFFANRNTESDQQNILTYEYFYNGGGVAIGDINNDGLVDIYFTSNLYENKLYLNKGDLQFEDITLTSGTSCKAGWKTGVCMADVNGDGWLDIYVCRSAYKDPMLRKNSLLINNKDLTFTDKAEQFGLADDSYSTQASFFDYDHDGDLDAFILNHSLLHISNSFDLSGRSPTKRFPYVGNKLLRNDNGRFQDVSDSLGIFGPSFNYGLAISISDVDNDGWPDIFSGSDYTGPDKLLLNNRGRQFLDATDSLFSHISKFSMGADIADVNRDGLMDIYTLDMLPEDNRRQKLLLGADRYNDFTRMVNSGLHYQYMRNMLQLNTGVGYFSEVGQLAGVSNTDWSWSPLLADFDNDGILDLFVSNGFKRDLTNADFAKYHAFRQIEESRRTGKPISYLGLIERFNPNKIHNYIFKGTDSLSFIDQVDEWGLEEASLTNGVAYGDLDNDGDLDLVMNQLDDVASIYRNNSIAKTKNHYLKVALFGEGKNRQATGAKVTVWTNNRPLTRELFPVRGFQSSADPTLHFGLGEVESIDSAVIRWPTGGYQILKNVQTNQKIEIKEPVGLALVKYQSPNVLFSREERVIDFFHHENEFVDFDTQSLLPRKYSTQGPALCSGDFNGDGLIDLFAGGSKGQASKLFLQNKDRKFIESKQPAFETDKASEDVDAVFFDADKDGDLDLYVVSGGYEYGVNDAFLQDRLYINDGNGKLRKTSLPEMLSSGSCVRPADIDGDGDLDLFVGGRLVPGRYPETPESYLLLNDGRGKFTKAENMKELSGIGMVTDAIWTDLNNDTFRDLIVVGEWMEVEVFVNERGVLKKQTAKYISEPTTGWWNCILARDFDNDGDEDFVVGNVGQNNVFKASPEKPTSLHYKDFDGNGSVDPLMTYFIKDISYPYSSRDELVEQLPMFKKRFTSYSAYADATTDEVLTEKDRAGLKSLAMVQTKTIFLRNDNGRMVVQPLSVEAQFAPVFCLESMDVNNDGHADLITAGNLSGTRSRTGKMTGNTGFIFLGDGKGHFKFLSPAESGLRCVGDVRHVVRDDKRLFFGVNNAPVMVYELK